MPNTLCLICYESYSDRQNLLPFALGCGHIFCNACIDDIKQAGIIYHQAKCPICKKHIGQPRRLYLELEEDAGPGKPTAANRDDIALAKKLTRDPPPEVVNQVAILTAKLNESDAASTSDTERIINEAESWIISTIVPEKWKALVQSVLITSNGARQRLDIAKAQRWEADKFKNIGCTTVLSYWVQSFLSRAATFLRAQWLTYADLQGWTRSVMSRLGGIPNFFPLRCYRR